MPDGQQEHVYLAQKPSGDVKIGYSRQPARRLSAIRHSSGEGQTTIIRVIDGGRPTERWLHRRFAAYRRTGEWFEFHPEMMEVVPPDELPKRRKPGTARPSLREALSYADAIVGERNPRLVIQMVISSLTNDEAQEFVSWIRRRSDS